MNVKKVFRNVVIVFVFLAIFCVAGVCYLLYEIQSSVDDWFATAQAAHPQARDGVSALLEYVQSESHTLRERNLAVWALGQARDGRALIIPEGFLTGEQCRHDSELCQKELKKAIKLCK